MDLAETANLMTRNKSAVIRFKALDLEKKIQKLSTVVRPWHETEGKQLRQALAKTQGNMALTALLLGIARTTLYRKLEKFRSRTRQGAP